MVQFMSDALHSISAGPQVQELILKGCRPQMPAGPSAELTPFRHCDTISCQSELSTHPLLQQFNDLVEPVRELRKTISFLLMYSEGQK